MSSFKINDKKQTDKQRLQIYIDACTQFVIKLLVQNIQKIQFKEIYNCY